MCSLSRTWLANEVDGLRLVGLGLAFGRAAVEHDRLLPDRIDGFLGGDFNRRGFLAGQFQQRGSAYACVLGALLELAGEKASPVEVVADEPIDAIWEEPVVFDGCSSKGQSRPDQAQPIHIVPRAARAAGFSTGAQP